MIISNLKIILIAMELSDTVKSIMDSSINIVGIIESRRKNPSNRSLELENYCNQKNVAFYYMNSGCDINLEKWVKTINPDLIIVNGMSELLKKNILDIPKKGCINLHPTLLPNYRGGYPIFWTFYDQTVQPGVTIHYLDEGEDTGDIIYQESFELPLGSTEEEFIDYSENKLGVKLLLKAIMDIENNCEPRIKQPKASTTVRARQIKPVEYKEIVDWKDWEIERIWHLLRGTQNWLNVFDFSQIQGDVRRWRILDYEKSRAPVVSAKLGTVYKQRNDYFVYCSNGKIYMELDFETK